MNRAAASAPLLVRADWNHSGRLSSRPREADAYVIVPLAPEADAATFAAPAVLEIDARSTAAGATGGMIEVSVTEEGARGRVRLYARGPAGAWRYLGAGSARVPVDPDGRATLGVAATPPASGDRAAYANAFTLRVTGYGGGAATTPPVRCRIAPLLLASSLDPVEEVLVVRNDLTARFVAELSRLAARADGRPKMRFLDHAAVPHDLWMQDTVEIARAPVPSGGRDGARQTVAPLLGLRAKHDGIRTDSLDSYVAEHFARNLPGAVCVRPAEPRPATRWIDWYGNLEVSPPVKGFPHGRVLTGDQKGLTIHPDLLALLEAQGVQTPPLLLDVGWLTIGHVDETINFVPARDRQGFRALLPSPALARDLLDKAVKDGHGEAKVFAGHKSETTAAKLLEEVGRSRETDAIEEALRATRARLREGLGLDDADIVTLPVLFKNGLAVIPNGVNCLVLGRDLVIPDPAGPVAGGEDLFRRAIREQLESLGARCHFVDIYEPYHVRSGEIHCGTNAIRRLANPRWWATGR